MVKHFSRPWTKPYKPSCARRFFIITAAFVRPGRDCLPLQTTPGRAAEAPYPSPQQRPSAPAEAAASLLSPPPRTCPRTTRPRTPHTQLRGRAPHTHTHTHTSRPQRGGAAGPSTAGPPRATGGQRTGGGGRSVPQTCPPPLPALRPGRALTHHSHRHRRAPSPRHDVIPARACAHRPDRPDPPKRAVGVAPRAILAGRGGAGRGERKRTQPPACVPACRAAPRRACSARHGQRAPRRPPPRAPALAPSVTALRDGG